MSNTITAEQIEARLKELDDERRALETLLSIRKGHPASSGGSPAPRPKSTSSSIRGRVVDSVVELIHNLGRQVRNEEILEHIEKKGISLGNTKNKTVALGVILSQECDKKTARLKRVTRGVYDLR